MSCFVRIATRLTNKETIKRAAEQLGYRVLEDATRVRGYDSTEVEAEVVLDTGSHYDIGAVKAEDGTYAFISDWSMGRVNQQQFVEQMSQKYSYLQVLDTVTARGFVLAGEQVNEQGTVQLVLRKFS